MRILVNPLQHQVSDAQVVFLGHDVLGNQDKLDELKEGVIYMMENLNFIPDEYSYVAPWAEPDDETKEAEEDKKDVEEENQKSMPAAKGQPPAPAKDPKKMTAAEKKKAEEEAKKREEDSKAAAAMADSNESRLERERAEELAR